MEQHEVFPPMVVQMIAVGEETGALDEMLDKIADFYDQEVSATVDALTSLMGETPARTSAAAFLKAPSSMRLPARHLSTALRVTTIGATLPKAQRAR